MSFKFSYLLLMIMVCIILNEAASFGANKLPSVVTQDVQWFDFTGEAITAYWRDGARLISSLDPPLSRSLDPLSNTVKTSGVYGTAATPGVTYEITVDATGNTIVGFVDHKSGKYSRRVELKGKRLRQVLGLTSDGKQLMSTTNDLKIIAVDTTTGEERESYDLAKSDAFTTETPLAIPNWHMTKVSSDGKMCVICMGDKIVALDDSGKEKWRVTSGNGDQVYVFPPQPLVAEGLSVYSLASQKLYSIQFSNGKPTGGLPIVDFQSIRATTSDGTKCAVAEKNGMVIRSLDPTDKSSVLIDLDMQCYFSDDGKLLYGMPTMKALSFDQKTNTATLGRAESSFFMFDAATGKQVKKIAISHP